MKTKIFIQTRLVQIGVSKLLVFKRGYLPSRTGFHTEGFRGALRVKGHRDRGSGASGI